MAPGNKVHFLLIHCVPSSCTDAQIACAAVFASDISLLGKVDDVFVGDE